MPRDWTTTNRQLASTSQARVFNVKSTADACAAVCDRPQAEHAAGVGGETLPRGGVDQLSQLVVSHIQNDEAVCVSDRGGSRQPVESGIQHTQLPVAGALRQGGQLRQPTAAKVKDAVLRRSLQRCHRGVCARVVLVAPAPGREGSSGVCTKPSSLC